MWFLGSNGLLALGSPLTGFGRSLIVTMARHLGSGDGLTGTQEPAVTIDRLSKDAMQMNGFGFSVHLVKFHVFIFCVVSAALHKRLRCFDNLIHHE